MPDTRRDIAMSDDLWRRLRLRAINENTSATELARRAIAAYLDGTVAPKRSTVAGATEGKKR